MGMLSAPHAAVQHAARKHRAHMLSMDDLFGGSKKHAHKAKKVAKVVKKERKSVHMLSAPHAAVKHAAKKHRAHMLSVDNLFGISNKKHAHKAKKVVKKVARNVLQRNAARVKAVKKHLKKQKKHRAHMLSVDDLFGEPKKKHAHKAKKVAKIVKKAAQKKAVKKVAQNKAV